MANVTHYVGSTRWLLIKNYSIKIQPAVLCCEKKKMYLCTARFYTVRFWSQISTRKLQSQRTSSETTINSKFFTHLFFFSSLYNVFIIQAPIESRGGVSLPDHPFDLYRLRARVISPENKCFLLF